MDRIREVIDGGIREGVFPGAVLLVARRGRVVFFESFGNRILVPRAAPMKRQTIFDLASLTKVFATTLAMMKLVDSGRVGLDQHLSELIPGADLAEKRVLTPRLLLTHSSGLPAHKPFFTDLVEYPPDRRKQVLRDWIVREPDAYERGKGSVYSDLGFMLLEWVIEARTGTTLKEFTEESFYEPLGLKRTFFRAENLPSSHSNTSPPSLKGEKSFVSPHPAGGKKEKGKTTGALQFAATQYCPWRKRLLLGEVDDENAFALGGHSGHAGLFSTAEDVWTLSDMLRGHYLAIRSDFLRPETVREFFRRQDIVEGSDWALGWDTRALKGSSAGKFFSRDSVGHTGFTGTSVWMDLVKDVTAIFLTNRVHPTRDNTEKFKDFRPRVHNAIMEDLGYGETE